MATGSATYYWPNEAGCADSPYGTMRLCIEESWNDENNSSSLTIKLQINSQYGGQWAAKGLVKLNDESIIVNNQAGSSSASGSWADVITVTKSNLAHGDDGKLAIRLEVQKSGYSRFAMVNQSNTSVYAYLDVTAGESIELHTSERGSAAVINGDKYEIYINGADGWKKYDLFIGNGKEWGRY